MSKDLTVFENEEFGEVRVIDKDGEPWFVGKDVADILGYSGTTQMTKRLDDDEKADMAICHSSSNQQRNQTVITESGLYEAIFGSKKPNAKAFKKWVKTEVLPTIRKTGGYVQENRAIDFVNNWLPSLDDASKGAIAGVLEENRKLVVKIEIDKPLVEFANTVADASDAIDIMTFSKVINNDGIKIGRNKLFSWMRVSGYLMKGNTPYQRYIENGYFNVVEKVTKTPWGDKIYTQTLVTGKGQIALVSKLNKEKLGE